MASIRRGYSDDFVIKNSGVGINTTEPQQNLDVAGVVKGQDLKVTGISSLTAYEGFLRADHQITENTTLTFDQGPVSSLSGEIIVGTGVTVTVSKVEDEFANANNGTVWSNFLTVSTGGFTSNYEASKAFDGDVTTYCMSSVNEAVFTFTPPTPIQYKNRVRIWLRTSGHKARLNGGTYIFNIGAPTVGQWMTIATGSGLINTIDVQYTQGSLSAINAIEVDGEILVDGFSTLVDKGARAGGSEIECLKVFNTFTPPNGGTNERPYAPKPGQLYYNYDFKTIEFFDGYGWRQVDNTTRSGRAVFAGGYITGNGRTKDMMLIQIHTRGNATYFGDLANDETTDKQGVGSQVRGVFAGGYNAGRRVDMDYITIASEGNGIDFGNLTVGRNAFASASSSTRGLFAGGATPTPAVNSTNDIDYIQISTLGAALDFGDLTNERSASGGISSPTRGVFGSGDDYSHPAWTGLSVGTLDYSTFASKGNAVDFGEDSVARITGNGCGNGIRGCWAGGYIAPTLGGSAAERGEAARAMTYVTIASTGNAIQFGTLTMGSRTYIGASSTSTRGIWTGGSSYPVHHTEIDYVNFASLGDSLDFGDLYREKGYMTGSVSDSHGGLGGF
jgi:hypothetical protein